MSAVFLSSQAINNKLHKKRGAS